MRSLIHHHLPDELGLEHLLWNKQAVQELIHERTGELLPERTLTAYMDRWGFAPDRPMTLAYKERPMLIRSWMRSDYPVIAFQAKEEKAELYWWGDVELKPNLRMPRQVHNPSHDAMPHMAFVVSNRGISRWCVLNQPTSTWKAIEILDKFLYGRQRKLYLIAPNDPILQTPEFRSWTEVNRTSIDVHYFPFHDPNSGLAP